MPVKGTIMRSYRFADGFDGQEWLRLNRPLVYGWWRGWECLYIGRSENGFTRVISDRHHVINIAEPVQPNDEFKLYFVKEGEPDDHAIYVEELFIRQYRPTYNKTGNPSYERPSIKRSELRKSKVLKGFSTKEELAAFLHSPLQKSGVLEQTRSSGNKTTYGLTEEEYERSLLWIEYYEWDEKHKVPTPHPVPDDAASAS